MNHPAVVWLEVIGEGRQHQASALSGAPRPVITVQHIIFSTDFMGNPMTPSQAVQVFVQEALDCVEDFHNAFLYVQQDEEAERLDGCVCLIGVEKKESDKVFYRWFETTGEGMVVPQGRSLGGYTSPSKAILNALLSIGWVVEALKDKDES